MPLVINSLGGRHTHICKHTHANTHTHTDDLQRINFKKPSVCRRPVAWWYWGSRHTQQPSCNRWQSIKPSRISFPLCKRVFFSRFSQVFSSVIDSCESCSGPSSLSKTVNFCYLAVGVAQLPVLVSLLSVMVSSSVVCYPCSSASCYTRLSFSALVFSSLNL